MAAIIGKKYEVPLSEFFDKTGIDLSKARPLDQKKLREDIKTWGYIIADVTTDDIQHGKQNSCISCPMALALTRRYGGVWQVNNLNATAWRFGFPAKGSRSNRVIVPTMVFNQSQDGTWFIIGFDTFVGKEVSPGEFQLTLTDKEKRDR